MRPLTIRIAMLAGLGAIRSSISDRLRQHRYPSPRGCDSAVCARLFPRQWSGGLRIQVQEVQEVRQEVQGKDENEER